MEEEKNKGGRPRYEVDYKLLSELCEIQCTGSECASVLDVSYDALNRALNRDGHGGFKEYYKKHSEGGKTSLRRVQFKAALNGSVPMMIWLGKQTLGQTDKSEVDTTVNTVELIPPPKPE